jgi:hypothetical protein
VSTSSYRNGCYLLIKIIIIFQGLGLLACSGSEFIFLKLMNLFGQLAGLLGRGISPTQGLYLHRTTQHRKTRTHIHASGWIRTHDPSVRAVEDSTCLRPLGHWDRLLIQIYFKIVYGAIFHSLYKSVTIFGSPLTANLASNVQLSTTAAKS